MFSLASADKKDVELKIIYLYNVIQVISNYSIQIPYIYFLLERKKVQMPKVYVRDRYTEEEEVSLSC